MKKIVVPPIDWELLFKLHPELKDAYEKEALKR